ncbi:MAG: hypothetical protein AAF517_05325, partial [Planctomycetota bacterium]
MRRTCARAPVRIDPAGGGTDAPPYSVDHGGLVVNVAVSRHTFASVERLPAGQGVTIYSEDLGRGVHAQTVDDLPGKLEFLEGFVRRLVPPEDSILLVTDSDVPPSAGLGGSGSLGVAVVAALDRAYNVHRTPSETAAVANDIERRDLGYPGGDQDSFGAALGGVNRLEYLKGGGTQPGRLDIAPETLRELERRTLLIYTHEAHVSGNIHQDIKDSYALPDSPTLAAMHGLKASAERMAAALESAEWDSYTQALNLASTNLYGLHSSCDCDAHRRIFRELDSLILAGKTC